MKYIIKDRTIIQHVRGHDDVKLKYTIEDENGQVVYGMAWELLKGQPLVYDASHDDAVMQHTWSMSAPGYAWNKQIGYMHGFIAKLAGMEVAPGMSIDHINMCKLDNRLKNLRVATQSQQNANRGTRSDKLPPCQELIDKGINELPKYVRWDNTEAKFVIEKHPALIEEVMQEKRKKAVMSGSKSKNISIVQKYQDILARLQDLDRAMNIGVEDDAFNQLKEECTREYAAICACINAFENKPDNETPEPSTPPPLSLAPTRHTAEGRKTVSKLPDGCGVTQEQIPKYCYYKPASSTRGDAFIIDKHPELLKEGKRQWRTSERRTLTTQEKFQQLMEMYAQLSIA
jgi:hypothetical protein